MFRDGFLWWLVGALGTPVAAQAASFDSGSGTFGHDGCYYEWSGQGWQRLGCNFQDRTGNGRVFYRDFKDAYYFAYDNRHWFWDNPTTGQQ